MVTVATELTMGIVSRRKKLPNGSITSSDIRPVPGAIYSFRVSNGTNALQLVLPVRTKARYSSRGVKEYSFFSPPCKLGKEEG